MSPRKLAVAAGILYLITHVTSVAAVILYEPVVGASDPITAPGGDVRMTVGALLDVILALAAVGTSVALYPVVKRKAQSLAMGYVGLRTLEAGLITLGVVSLLTLVTLRQDVVVGGDTSSLQVAGDALVGLYEFSFRVGPNLVLATSTVVLAYALFRSRLVPRWIAMLGLVGGPLIFAWATGSTFGLWDHFSVWGGVVTVPVFAWELSLAFWLLFKGFDESVLDSSDEARQTAREMIPAV